MKYEVYDMTLLTPNEMALIIWGLRRGDCWCEMAIGHPSMKNHSDTCRAITERLDKRKKINES